MALASAVIVARLLGPEHFGELGIITSTTATVGGGYIFIDEADTVFGKPGANATQATHPFGYPEDGLDVERTRELGHHGFKGIMLADDTRHGACAFGAFNAIIGQLADVANFVNAGPGDDIHTNVFGRTVPLDKRPRGTVHIASADLQHATARDPLGRQLLVGECQTVMITHGRFFL